MSIYIVYYRTVPLVCSVHRLLLKKLYLQQATEVVDLEVITTVNKHTVKHTGARPAASAGVWLNRRISTALWIIIGPNSTWLVTSRRVERVKPCCSDMAGGEQDIVLACKSLVVFMLLHTQFLFVPSMK